MTTKVGYDSMAGRISGVVWWRSSINAGSCGPRTIKIGHRVNTEHKHELVAALSFSGIYLLPGRMILYFHPQPDGDKKIFAEQTKTFSRIL